ncbi:MAG TPA: hypothetical protein VF184_12635 [Phycisphaeraceae bacterium]
MLQIGVACPAVMAMALASAAQPMRPAEAVQADGPRQVSLAWVLYQLQQEPEQARLTSENVSSLQREPDFAQVHRVRLDPLELHQALTRRLHADAGLDAYLRWQLLSFEPELEHWSMAQHAALIHALPPIRPLQAQAGGNRPGLDGLGLSAPTLGVVRSGAVLDASAFVPAHDPRYVVLNMQASQTNVIRIRQIAQTMARPQPLPPADADENAKVIRYREALIERLPRRSGVRLIARFQDVRDRLAAGDPSTPVATEALMAELAHLDRDVQVDPATRRMLRNWAKSLASLNASASRGQADPPAANQGRPPDTAHAPMIQPEWIERIVSSLAEPNPPAAPAADHHQARIPTR